MTGTTPSPSEHAHAIAELLAPALSRLADPANAERVSVSDAYGRVLATDVVSTLAVPPFTNSQMDGYAVRAADLSGATGDAPVSLAVGPTSAAGDPVREHKAGTATPVMTGAPIPEGADAVVQIEVVDPPHFIGIGEGSHDAPEGTSVAFASPVDAGAFVRPVGVDLSPGATILTAGTRLGPAQLGSLAAGGVTTVDVRSRPVVLLISTGHELRAPGEPLEPGQIYDANTTSLTAALHEAGALPIGISTPDDAAAVRAAIDAHASADIIVTTGGVSAGAFEVVRDALEPAGVHFGHVAMQPGGPQGYGLALLDTASGPREVPVVAFPGNPVSALLSFEMFLRPLLRSVAGLAPGRVVATAPLAHAIVSPIGKHQVRRGMLRDDGSVEVGAPGSHLLHDYARATVLAHVPIGVDALPAGAEVEIWRIDE
ncbi:molybdopterin molybdotransferase MoeA [Microbacterium sp. CH12i]|uniref:molybdopterin molybdotransferase MoeA n=1 Tax=Microbacterium sp. CH12i TaxID=1479651 RepID=UPI0005652DF7|nr:gephyrin-like molybdotransferase Glp [Microbacterium sp. CH12i]